MSDQDRTIWCGNLPRELKDEHLYELFLQAGPLERVFRPKDRESGESREYAFVTFEDEESVPYALDLFQDTQLYGRTIRMQPRGVAKRPPQLSRTTSLPLMQQQQHQARPVPPQQWQPPPPPPPPNEVLMRQMAARQMMMLATQQAQQVAMAQRFQHQQQFQRQGPWQQRPNAFMPRPPGFGPGPFGGGGPRPGHHQRSHTHHW